LQGWSGQAGLTSGAITSQLSATYNFVAGRTYKIDGSKGSLQIVDITK
jgi:hypothetical protein